MDHLIIAQATNESQVTLSIATVVGIASSILSLFILLFNIYLAYRFKTLENSDTEIKENHSKLEKEIKKMNEDMTSIRTNYLQRFQQVENKVSETKDTIVEKIDKLHDKIIDKIDDIKDNFVSKELFEKTRD